MKRLDEIAERRHSNRSQVAREILATNVETVSAPTGYVTSVTGGVVRDGGLNRVDL